MKRSIYTLTVILSFLLTTGCRKEAKLTPSDKPEDTYGDPTLPQGNHPYDADIKQLFQKYRTLFLYKYKPRDIYYNVDQSAQGIYDTPSNMITKPGWFDVPANEQYIGQQLDLLKEIWLGYYPDSLLRKGLPQKVYLLDSFYNAHYTWPSTGPGKPEDNIDPAFNGDGYSGVDFMIATWGGSRIAGITKEEKYALKGSLNASFLTFAHKLGAIKVPNAFATVTDYSALNWSNMYEQGVIYIDNNGNTPDKDWDSYVTAIVSNSYDVLTTNWNILDPATDTAGMIRKRYDIVIAYFKTTFGVDLQAIGNAGS